MKNSIKKEQFNDLWDMYKIAHKIDIAWQDYRIKFRKIQRLYDTYEYV